MPDPSWISVISQVGAPMAIVIIFIWYGFKREDWMRKQNSEQQTAFLVELKETRVDFRETLLKIEETHKVNMRETLEPIRESVDNLNQTITLRNQMAGLSRG